MDIQRPGMDGFQATAAIRELEKQTGAHIPVIAMTAHALAGYKERCLAAGMDGYLTKPIRTDLLLQALADFQGAPGMGPSPEMTKPAETKLEEAHFDTDDLVERLMGNEDLAKRVAGAFIDQMPEQLAALAAAIRNADAPAARMAAHSIKGAAANVGCETVREVAHLMEQLGESGALAQASEVMQEVAASFEAVKPAIQRFCSEG
jgi:HPt (histidine-containing phosphotransfer) domain-containing protein